MSRAFVAVTPPAQALDAVEERVESVALAGLRVLPRDQWHLTLQFLGNRVDVDAVIAALESASFPACPPARFGGAGAFPKPQRATVLWVGLADGRDGLGQLAQAVWDRLAPLGYEPEHREFRPHLTVARAKRPVDLRPMIEAVGDEPVGEAFRVGELVVFESRLRPSGAEHVARAVVSLGGP